MQSGSRVRGMRMARGATIQSDLVEKRRKINEIIDMPVIYEVLKAI